MDAKVQDVLAQLRHLQSSIDLSILKLSEPITAAAASSSSSSGDVLSKQQQQQQRTSDASNASLDGPTPAGLAADLAHYKELFAKLRFSYVEQVTKEKFIRGIVRDPPLVVALQENLDLERDNAEAKSQLKVLKLEVADTVAALEARGRQLCRRHAGIKEGARRLETVPAACAALEARIAALREEHGDNNYNLDDANLDSSNPRNPSLALPLAGTAALVARRRDEQLRLARELETLHARAPRRRREADMLRAELLPLEARRQSSLAAAREARRRRDAALGGAADDLERRARWWRASEAVLRQVLDLEA
ncbi:Kinetochore protein Sos7 [Escovopsis weberi]|uniref:Kinetochore protein Sos7 n=1 Tax=Escovopsis weberi TaxID=150374 RepID=A0A0M8MV67_ESCWE|nr:Kinetochore protein Sos7 [Escovopsis weberi]